ncbi:hypothetical protein DID88_003325 [Monilinia fructigena]|uniref:Uncharacterized protein n=1 Tax=Monilinia fructigena TaxID=38457 RepID=A0A395IV02_9HELO|nr:hypothetical protein DID88_003325 [Monilinia fructigena]
MPPGLSASYRRWKLGYSVTEPPELRLPVQCYIGSWLPERHTAISRSTTEGSATPKRSSPASAGSRRLPTTSYSARSPNASFTPGRLDPNARPAARGRAEIPKRTTGASELFENFLAVTQYFAINARAQRTRDQTIPGGSHMSYGSPRQNRHSLTAT